MYESVQNQKIFVETVAFEDKPYFKLTWQLGQQEWHKNKLLFSAAVHLSRAKQKSAGSFWLECLSLCVYLQKSSVSVEQCTINRAPEG